MTILELESNMIIGAKCSMHDVELTLSGQNPVIADLTNEDSKNRVYKVYYNTAFVCPIGGRDCKQTWKF